jgi:hypothetical protein
MLQESMDKIKVENDMDFVTDGDSIVIKTDEEDIPSSFSGKKAEPEVNLFVDEVLGGCASVCVHVSAVHLQYDFHFKESVQLFNLNKQNIFTCKTCTRKCNLCDII